MSGTCRSHLMVGAGGVYPERSRRVLPAQPVPDSDRGAGTQGSGAGRAAPDIPHFPVSASVSYTYLHEHTPKP